MDSQLFGRFLESQDCLWVCHQGAVLFSSNEEGLVPLVTYIERFVPATEGVLVCDRVVGNAAALLLQKARCQEVYGVVGSEIAAHTLRGLGIATHFVTTVPHILNKAGNDLCPMERASIGKTPEQFLQMVKQGFSER